MNNPIIDAIESVKSQMTAETGIALGARMSPAESTIALRGDPLLALGYASLFFPNIYLKDGIPYTNFATRPQPLPIDCVHVNLMHQHDSLGSSDQTYAALGMVLAETWNIALRRSGVVGRFQYEATNEPYVVYESP